MASYREIDYTVRPAKSVERKMMVDAFRRLNVAWPLDSYRYIGMGSVYFADFQIIHEQLGICDMVSLELEGQPKTRFNFNKPFACIRMEYRNAEQPLPEIPWDKPSIAWFDYDGKLNSNVISDVRTVVQRAASGTMFCISLNVAADRPSEDVKPEELDDWRLAQFTESVGTDNIPSGLSGRALRQKDLPGVVWGILDAAVRDQLSKRNGRSDTRPDTIMAQQVFHFHYADDAPMFTVGWLIHSVVDCGVAQNCGLMTLPYARDGASPFSIRAPKLTRKEARFFLSHLPHANPAETYVPAELSAQTGVPESDIERFRHVYRFYPSYVEAPV